MLKEMVEQGVGEKEGGVGYAEIEIDAPDILGEIAHRYTVCWTCIACNTGADGLAQLLTRLDHLRANAHGFLTTGSTDGDEDLISGRDERPRFPPAVDREGG